MSPHKALFQDLRPLSPPVAVKLGDHSTVYASLCGEISVAVSINGTMSPLTLQRVLYVSRLGCSLLSVPALGSHGWIVSFDATHCKIAQGS
ncbi:hypothetical protein CXG81DRAFT_916, partial [Caulochytrium protostelioides]